MDISNLSYIYIYELLNGIGAESAEDSLLKMKAFEKNYLDTGLGDEDILATDALTDHDLRLTIVEMTDICIAEIDADMVSDFFCQFRIRVTGKDA